PGEHVREALAARVVEVRGELDTGQPLPGGGEELRHLARVRHPGGVAEGDLLAARLGETLADAEHPVRWHLPLVGTADGDRDHALAAEPFPPGNGDGPLEPSERVGDRAVDV